MMALLSPLLTTSAQINLDLTRIKNDKRIALEKYS
jgi:hypothetical protein